MLPTQLFNLNLEVLSVLPIPKPSQAEINLFPCRHLVFGFLWYVKLGFPGGSVVKNPFPMQEMQVLISGWGRSPEEVNGNPLRYSCLENLMDRGTWWATNHGVAKTQLSD